MKAPQTQREYKEFVVNTSIRLQAEAADRRRFWRWLAVIVAVSGLLLLYAFAT